MPKETEKTWPMLTRAEIVKRLLETPTREFEREFLDVPEPKKLTERPVFIFAGSYVEFHRFCSRQELGRKEAVFVHDEHHLRGMRGNGVLHLVGTWNENPHCRSILNIAEYLGWTFERWEENDERQG